MRRARDTLDEETPNCALHQKGAHKKVSGMNGSELRQLIIEAAKGYADSHNLPHYLSLGRTNPVALFLPSQKPLQHGNFLDASYSAICGNPAWARRLAKAHSQRQALPEEHRAEAMELDSCTSSDALLMNVFCYPGVFQHGPLARLLGLPTVPEPRLDFGFNPGVPRRNSGRDTEVDLRVEDLLIEAKLTETDFTDKRIDVVERYCDFRAVFEPSTLPMLRGQYRHYQLLRNVLAAHHLGFRFRLICDERRNDLIDAMSCIVSAVRDPALRARCGVVTWQEVARCVPEALGYFLLDKYGIVPSDSVSLRNLTLQSS